MLRLSVVFNPKELWLVGYGSMVCDDNDEWYFGDPEDEWSNLVPDIGWWGLSLAIDST